MQVTGRNGSIARIIRKCDSQHFDPRAEHFLPRFEVVIISAKGHHKNGDHCIWHEGMFTRRRELVDILD